MLQNWPSIFRPQILQDWPNLVKVAEMWVSPLRPGFSRPARGMMSGVNR